MNENELLEYQKMLELINSYNKKSDCKGKTDDSTVSSYAFAGNSAAPGEGPLPLPTPSVVPENIPASPSGPLPLPTPSLPAKPQRPSKPLPPFRPPWVDIKPAGNCVGMCLPFAYPEVEVRNVDSGTACIIYDLFAGRVSELSSFLTYTYDGAYFYDEDGNIGKIFKDIASCRLNHLNMLALLITKSGSMPKYQDCVRGKFSWWSASEDIKYPSYLKMALLDAIDMETKLIENYNSAASEVRDPYVSTLLRRLVMDNQYHLEVLTESYNDCCR